MAVYAILLILSVMGAGETVYLIKKRKDKKGPVCFLGEDCQKVLESKHNKTLGVYNDILGLSFYITVFSISVLLTAGEAKNQELWGILIKIIIFGGALLSLYFTYIQWRVIKEWCFWCVASAFITFLMAVIILLG